MTDREPAHLPVISGGVRGLDFVNKRFCKREKLGPHKVRPYFVGGKTSAVKCVRCGETALAHDKRRLMAERCEPDTTRPGPYGDWLDAPCEHAKEPEKYWEQFSRNDEPWQGGLWMGGPLQKPAKVPVNYTHVGEESWAEEVNLEGGGWREEWHKCKTYQCNECGEVHRGPDRVPSSRMSYPRGYKVAAENEA